LATTPQHMLALLIDGQIIRPDYFVAVTFPASQDRNRTVRLPKKGVGEKCTKVRERPFWH
jgi:hypothetical protein